MTLFAELGAGVGKRLLKTIHFIHGTHDRQEHTQLIHTFRSPLHRAHPREVGGRTKSYIEDLDSARDRAAVAHEELNSRLSQQMNHRMYALSVIAGIFLPLSFVTGLLGINAGGILGTESPMAFALVCIGLLVLASVRGWLFRRRRWL